VVIQNTENGKILYEQNHLRRMLSSGMWCCVGLVLTDVSEERIASMLRVEKSASEEPVWAGGCRLSHQSQKTTFFTVTAVKASNLTKSSPFFMTREATDRRNLIPSQNTPLVFSGAYP
jgi:hypothetical protein